MLEGCVPWPAELAEQYRLAGYWRDESLASLLREPAKQDGTSIAVATKADRIDYATLNQRVDRTAAGFHALGLRSGDRVVVQLPNIAEFVVVCVALFRLGALPVLVLPAHRRSELEYLCRQTEATALIIPDRYRRFDHRELARTVQAASPSLAHVVVHGEADGFVPLAELDASPKDLPDPDPAEVALFLLSGGTTGRPKLIPRTHHDYAYQMRATASEMGFDATGVYLAALPAAHNAALGSPGVLGALLAGGTAVLADSPSPDEVFPLIAREHVTLTTLMPAFLPLWMDTASLFGADLSRLTIEVGGARLDPELARRAEPALGATLTRWFGTAEGLLSFTRPSDPPEIRYRTEGRPLSPADEIRVVDDALADVPAGATGEMLVRGPYTVRGYYRAEEYNATAFTPDGFYRTGDLVRRDHDGRLVVVGRVKDVVNRGGEKVPTGEVEDHLRSHPGVRDAAVLAVPDASLGEKSCACVIAATEPAPTLDALRDHLIECGLAEYKLPDRLAVVEQFPRTPIGKVDKNELRRGLG